MFSANICLGRRVGGVYASIVNAHSPTFIDALEPRQLMSITIDPGVNYNTVLKTAGAQKNFTVSLTAGQPIVITAGDVNNSSTLVPEIVLFLPSGKTLARSSGATGAMVSRTAPVTGTYRFRIQDTANHATGSIQATTFFNNGTTIIDGDDASSVANSGQRFGATISPGDLDVWRIDAKAGQYLSVIADENTPGDGIGIGILVVGPDGKGLVSGQSNTGVTLTIPDQGAGTYYAVVSDFGLTTTGRYGISFIQTPGPQATEDPDTQTPLKSGVVRNGQIPAGDVDVFQVPIGRGRSTTITATRATGNTTPDLLLIDPNGKLVASATGTTTATLTFDATVSGTYSIALLNGVDGTGGSYNLTYVLK